jgi:hypothetical protein
MGHIIRELFTKKKKKAREGEKKALEVSEVQATNGQAGQAAVGQIPIDQAGATPITVEQVEGIKPVETIKAVESGEFYFFEFHFRIITVLKHVSTFC